MYFYILLDPYQFTQNVKRKKIVPSSSVVKAIKILTTPSHITCMKYLLNVSIAYFTLWKNFQWKGNFLCYATNYKKTEKI